MSQSSPASPIAVSPLCQEDIPARAQDARLPELWICIDMTRYWISWDQAESVE